jgi:hypothetical protein
MLERGVGLRRSGGGVSVELDHTIVPARDKRVSADFLAQVLRLEAPTSFGPFLVLEAANGVSLDFIDTEGEINSQHYAFLVSESEFDENFGRIPERDLPYWADPGRPRPGEINHNDDGPRRLLPRPGRAPPRVITGPYGSGQSG